MTQQTTTKIIHSNEWFERNTLLLMCVVALVLVIFVIIGLVIICAVKRKRSDKPLLKRTSDQNEGELGTGPEYANAPRGNEELGVEYAEINMHLLAPKPEKQDNESDDEAAPLVYADLAFHDSKDGTQISIKRQPSELSPTDDTESEVQFDEDDTAAMYAKPMKKNKK